ncbi:hephaestin-like protein 1 isoform X2 [Rhinatrema bivittatum]|uniref:hephaestin-like protein 1 isoform X2 n=2 Tax=Rhinatrema bivittatum TaxID=194408 RepID=UPI00112AC24D|nr:hephaestin-like protein 1 isoform X2 [Rhinatrema bivittatum]
MLSLPGGCCRLALLLVGLLFQVGEAVTRVNFIAVEEEDWDYAQGGMILNLTVDAQASVYLTSDGNRIGSVYRKAIYREFTDATYTTEVYKPSWLGFLGPVLRAEEDDELLVHVKNFASRPYSVHPHGVFYEKDSEGALYPDGTSGKDKMDDFILPGKSYTYKWVVKKQYAPTSGDPNCLTWIYHSHVDAPRDISSGLIGALLTCKKGTLAGSTLSRTDVDKEFILMYSIVDENDSWYLDENIEKYCSEPGSVNKDDEDFQESNKMHAINGYVFGNLPGLEMCVGETVSWHLFGMGNEVDVHSAYFHGHTIINRGHRADIVNLFPATFVTAEMVAENPGKWLLDCQVNDHIKAGMQGLYEVKSCNSSVSAPPLTGQERRYYIAAEMVFWDYGPQGFDKFSGQALNTTGSDSETFFKQGHDRIGGQYWKVRYTEFTDERFNKRKERPKAEKHMGILGPVIKAEVSDTVLVMFSNKADRKYSILPHGVSYNKGFEGMQYADEFQKMGAYVKPGETFTYKWTVPENAGPTTSDPPCLTYLYYSAVDPVMDTNSGLVGPLLVCRKNSLHDDGTQKGVDKEFYLLSTIFDENSSWYLEKNIQMITGDPLKIDKEDEHFQESNKMHAINGFMYGNLPGLEMCQNDKISWHMIGLGTEVDLHGIYFQGNTIHLGGITKDTYNLFPHSSMTVSMQPDEVGSFEVSCRTTDHFTGGMKQVYTVKGCGGAAAPEPQQYSTVRTYFIAAKEVEWDYSPQRRWELEKHNVTEQESPGHIFVSKSEDRIGSKYKKVLYREYHNGDFAKAKARTPEEEHLGILGPTIRAEVGEIISVVFKNNARRPYSIHAQGVQEVNAGKEKKTLVTEPGEINIYRWNVPERSGPGSDDPNCISWVYYSSANFVKDMYSGLVGPLITCRRGTLNNKGLRKDVDREFALLFMMFDENESWYLNENIANYLHKDPKDFEGKEDFTESNLLHAINGKIYGNLHGLRMTEGEKTSWYLLGLGNEADMHTVHFHAQSFLFKAEKEHRADVYDLFPGTFQTIELIAGNPGTWLLHCHVTDHIHAGMETTFTIHRKSAAAPPRVVDECTSAKDAGHQKLELLGRSLDAKEANTALVVLFIVGVLLLAMVLLLFGALVLLRRKVSYWSIETTSLPVDNL